MSRIIIPAGLTEYHKVYKTHKKESTLAEKGLQVILLIQYPGGGAKEGKEDEDKTHLGALRAGF